MPELFWGSFNNSQNASKILCSFADDKTDCRVGVSYSDGNNISVLRRPIAVQNDLQWMHFVRPETLGAGCPIVRGSSGTYKKFPALIENTIHNVTNAWDNKSSTTNASIDLAIDLVAVVAGGTALVFGGGIIATVGLVAFGASLVSLEIDGFSFYFEINGEHARAVEFSENNTVKYIKYAAATAQLADLPVGYVSVWKNIRKSGKIIEITNKTIKSLNKKVHREIAFFEYASTQSNSKAALKHALLAEKVNAKANSLVAAVQKTKNEMRKSIAIDGTINPAMTAAGVAHMSNDPDVQNDTKGLHIYITRSSK